MTTDDTEAQFAAKLANSLVRPICVAYPTVIAVGGAKHKNRQVYLLWRDSADHVGKLIELFDERHGSDAADEALDLINAQHAAAQAAFEVTHRFSPPRMTRALEEGEQMLMEHKISDWIRACDDIARGPVPELQPFGAGLIEVFSTQHIFFGDLHSGNLGMVHHGDGERVVITDPGHVAVIAS